jgi:hypothetical protein
VSVTRCLQAAVVPKLKEAVLQSMAQIMKVDTAQRARRLILRGNSTCCRHTEVLSADERTKTREQLFRSEEAIVVRRHRDGTGTLLLMW